MTDTKKLRRALYSRSMDIICDPRWAPQPSGPWVEMSVEDRIEAMFQAKYGGLTEDELDGAGQIGG